MKLIPITTESIVGLVVACWVVARYRVRTSGEDDEMRLLYCAIVACAMFTRLSTAFAQSSDKRVDIPKASIEERQTVAMSAILEMDESSKSEDKKEDRLEVDPTRFSVEEQKDRLRISLSGKPIVDFVYRDEKILRPYFANARLPDGMQVTRNHPPINGVDAVDHDTMHPGIWLGLGNISGQDFWRNKAAMEHVRFVTAPQTVDGRLTYATECRLKSSTGEPLCLLTNHFTLTARPTGWLLVWSAEFKADQQEIVFGDQEEMGFGARMATPFTEKNGGLLRSSTGKRGAKDTWGQPAAWCDYSGTGPRSGGILLMASDKNFRESWWHNRDYGVFVSNPFGREAMKQGARSEVKLAKGDTLRITFGALVHDHREVDGATEFRHFKQTTSE